MNEVFCYILETANWAELVPRLENYADFRMRGLYWRGNSERLGKRSQLLLDNKSADDFVGDAVKKLVLGERTYNYDVSLEFNLKGTIRSLIWNHKAKFGRGPFIDLKGRSDEEYPNGDVSDAADPKSCDAERIEKVAIEKRLLDDFKASISDEPELLKLYEALQKDISKNAVIERETGISAIRISEVKRKLKRHFIKFEKKHPETENLELKRR
jgi:hypothetical protein